MCCSGKWQQAFKDESQDAEAGPTEGGEAGRPARLDKKIQAYHGVLGKASVCPLISPIPSRLRARPVSITHDKQAQARA